MVKWAIFILLTVGSLLVACVADEGSRVLITPDGKTPSTITIQEIPPVTNSLAESTPTPIATSEINVKTDSELYRQGESITVTIENNSTYPIHFVENCSLNLCYESKEDWICEERECDGPLTVLEPGRRLELLQEAKSINLAATNEICSRYKLNYQIISEDPYYFAHSNEFSVQRRD